MWLMDLSNEKGYWADSFLDAKSGMELSFFVVDKSIKIYLIVEV